MTETDKPAFAAAYDQLAVAFRPSDIDDLTMTTYFVSLRDLEVDYLVAAVEVLLKSGTFFPRVSEWRAAAAGVERQRRQEQREILRKLPTPLCADCADTGWREIGRGLTAKGQTAPRRAEPCACVALRRLERLGRRPMPRLPAASMTPPTRADRDRITRIETAARRALRAMPKVRVVDIDEARRQGRR